MLLFERQGYLPDKVFFFHHGLKTCKDLANLSADGLKGEGFFPHMVICSIEGPNEHINEPPSSINGRRLEPPGL